LAARNFQKTATEEFGLDPRLAFVKTPMWDKADADTEEVFENLAKELGETCFNYDLPAHYASAWTSHRAIMATEMAHNLGKLTDQGGDKVSKQFRDLIEEGRRVSATDYLAAVAEGQALRSAIEELFQHQCTALVTPAARGVAPKGEATGDPVFCTFWTLLGLPAITLPLLTGEDDMPLGVQLVGAPGDDARLLRTAQWVVTQLVGAK
jgi:Asp-tRNA(Asn)/Glu-tRNA(Gln) amidotransferase A subunit family amidase